MSHTDSLFQGAAERPPFPRPGGGGRNLAVHRPHSPPPSYWGKHAPLPDWYSGGHVPARPPQPHSVPDRRGFVGSARGYGTQSRGDNGRNMGTVTAGTLGPHPARGGGCCWREELGQKCEMLGKGKQGRLLRGAGCSRLRPWHFALGPRNSAQGHRHIHTCAKSAAKGHTLREPKPPCSSTKR